MGIGQFVKILWDNRSMSKNRRQIERRKKDRRLKDRRLKERGKEEIGQKECRHKTRRKIERRQCNCWEGDCYGDCQQKHYRKTSIDLAKHIGAVSAGVVAVSYNIAKDSKFAHKLIDYFIFFGLMLVFLSFLFSTMVIYHHLRHHLNTNPNPKDLEKEIKWMVLTFMYGVSCCLISLMAALA